jgi:hypothetical protein
MSVQFLLVGRRCALHMHELQSLPFLQVAHPGAAVAVAHCMQDTFPLGSIWLFDLAFDLAFDLISFGLRPCHAPWPGSAFLVQPTSLGPCPYLETYLETQLSSVRYSTHTHAQYAGIAGTAI